MLCSHNTFLWSDRLRPTVQRGRCGKRRVWWLSPTSTLTSCSNWTVFCTLQALCAVAGPKPKKILHGVKYFSVFRQNKSVQSKYSLDTSFMMSPSKSSILPAAMRSLALWLISPAILLHWRNVSASAVWPAASHTSTSSLQMVRPCHQLMDWWRENEGKMECWDLKNISYLVSCWMGRIRRSVKCFFCRRWIASLLKNIHL